MFPAATRDIAFRLLVATPAAMFCLLSDFCYGDLPGPLGPEQCQKLDASWVSGSFALVGALSGFLGALRPRLRVLVPLQAVALTASVAVALGSVWLWGNVDGKPAVLMGTAAAIAWLAFWAALRRRNV